MMDLINKVDILLHTLRFKFYVLTFIPILSPHVYYFFLMVVSWNRYCNKLKYKIITLLLHANLPYNSKLLSYVFWQTFTIWLVIYDISTFLKQYYFPEYIF